MVSRTLRPSTRDTEGVAIDIFATARAYGSHSLRRAQRPLTNIEEQGLIVCQLDGTGRRTVTLVELAWATAPGDPNAEEVEQGNLAV